MGPTNYYTLKFNYNLVSSVFIGWTVPGNDRSGQSRQKAAEDDQKDVHLVVAGTEPAVEDEVRISVWEFIFIWMLISTI